MTLRKTARWAGFFLAFALLPCSSCAIDRGVQEEGKCAITVVPALDNGILSALEVRLWSPESGIVKSAQLNSEGRVVTELGNGQWIAMIGHRESFDDWEQFKPIDQRALTVAAGGTASLVLHVPPLHAVVFRAESRDGRELDGVNVRATPVDAEVQSAKLGRTNSDGAATLVLPEGEYVFSCAAGGRYGPSEMDVDGQTVPRLSAVPVHESRRVVCRFETEGSFRGVVRDERGRGVPGISIGLRQRIEEIDSWYEVCNRCAVTDQYGQFEMPMESSEADLLVAAVDRNGDRAPAWIRLPGPQPRRASVALYSPVAVRYGYVVLRNPDGSALPGVRAWVTPLCEHGSLELPRYEAVSDDAGRIHIPLGEGCKWTVEAFRPEWLSLSSGVTTTITNKDFQAALSSSVRFSVPWSRSLDGQLLLQNGQPASDVLLRCQNYLATTDERGRFLFRGLVPRRGRFVVMLGKMPSPESDESEGLRIVGSLGEFERAVPVPAGATAGGLTTDVTVEYRPAAGP